MDDHSTLHTNNQPAGNPKAVNLLGSPKAFVPPVWKFPVASLKPSDSIRANDPKAPFSLDNLLHYAVPKSDRDQRFPTRIHPALLAAAETLYYVTNEKVSLSKVGRYWYGIGSEHLAGLEDVVEILALKKTLLGVHRRQDLAPRRWEYRPLGPQAVRFNLVGFDEPTQALASLHAMALGFSMSAWIGLSMISGAANSPVGKPLKLKFRFELGHWMKMLMIRRDEFRMSLKMITEVRRKGLKTLAK